MNGAQMDFDTAQKKLDGIGQTDLLRFWPILSTEEQLSFSSKSMSSTWKCIVFNEISFFILLMA